MSFNRNILRLIGLVALMLVFQTAWGEVQSTRKEDAPLLRQNSSVEQQLSGGGKHAASVTLVAGQYFHLDIEQRGIDVVTTVFNPDGKQTEFDTPSGADGTEPIRFIAEVGGTYRIEFRSLLKEVDPGRYLARVIALREATAHDRLIVSAVAAQGMEMSSVRKLKRDRSRLNSMKLHPHCGGQPGIVPAKRV